MAEESGVFPSPIEQLGRKPTPEEAFWMFMTPVRVPMARKEKLVFDSAQSFEIKSDGEAIQGYSWGEGEKLAFLSHGWNGRAANLSAYVEPLLARGYRVLALDAPGHGESEGTVCNAPRYARCWLAVAEEYGSPQAMVCHSFGAMACTVAQKWNLSVENAIYLGPLSDIPKRFREFCRLCQFSDAEIEEMLRIARAHFSEFVLEDFNGDVAAKNFTSQGLIIHDDQDQEADWAEGKAIADAWPNAQMFTTSGLGHFRILRSQLVIKTVMDFLER